MPFAYKLWIGNHEGNAGAAPCNLAEMQGWDWCPQFAIVLHSHESYSSEEMDRSVRSLKRQVYPRWTRVEAAPDDLAAGVREATADFLVALRIGDELSKNSLFHIVAAARANRSAALFYGDEDQVDLRGRRTRPWFKPRWNEEMFFALDYLSSCVAIRTSIARESLQNDERDDIASLVVRATARAGGLIVHVPHILCHVHGHVRTSTDRLAAVSNHLQPLGATCNPGLFGSIKVQWPLPEKRPLVSIIIPTKDKIELLRPCVESVLARTNYRPLEILIVNNASTEKRTADYLSEISNHPLVRVLDYPEPYNFSALNNFAARKAMGTHLCLLNNDTEVVEPDWLTEMMRYAVRTNVGAVGAKLLYQDGSIQHAGVVIGMGQAAGHAHRFLRPGSPGYFLMPHVSQYISAVTGACLVVEKAKFEKVEGLSEEFAVAFNDVDFCLKLQAAGWQNVYVPHAVLIHHESKSRGKDTARRNVERYREELRALQERWGTATYEDPSHNPNLDRNSETFVIGL